MDLEYKLLGRNDCEGAINCIAESFFNKDSLSVALGISFNDWVSFANGEVNRSIDENLSFCAIDEKIVGALLAYDFLDYKPSNYILVDSFTPISKLMGELHEGYNVSDNVLHFSYIGVLLDYANKGVAHEMIIRNIDLAKNVGYRKIILEATSPYSRKAVSKLGFKTVNEIFYKDFSYNGEKVFEDINSTPSCALMELEL